MPLEHMIVLLADKETSKEDVLIWKDYLIEHFPVPQLLKLCDKYYEALEEVERQKMESFSFQTFPNASGTIIPYLSYYR